MDQFQRDVIWSGNEPVSFYDPVGSAAKMGLLTVGGAASLAWATKTPLPTPGGGVSAHTWLDLASSSAQTIGNLSPFQILNTFRAPEFLSPLESPAQKGLRPGIGGLQTTISAEHVQTKSTLLYLQKLTGLSAEELRQSGVGALDGEMDEDKLLKELVLRQDKPGESAQLVARLKSGREQTLHSDVSLMRASPKGMLLTDRRHTNRGVFGMFQVMDMWQDEGFKASEVFKDIGSSVKGKHAFPDIMPVPSVTKPGIGGQAGVPFALPRAYAAFEMNRFPELFKNTVTEVFGERGLEFFRNMGLSLEVTPGPALPTMFRIGGKAAKLGAIGLGVAQADWMRTSGIPGVDFIGNVGISAGIGYAARKLGAGSTGTMLAGASAFFALNVLPGFDEGLIPGMANIAGMGLQARGSILNPFAHVRRTIEGVAPGATNWKTGLLAGIGVGLLPSMRVPGSGKLFGDFIIDQVGHERLGVPAAVLQGEEIKPVKPISRLRDVFYQHTKGHLAEMGVDVKDVDTNSFFGKKSVLAKAFKHYATDGSGQISAPGVLKFTTAMKRLFADAEVQHRNMRQYNPLNTALNERLHNIALEYEGRGSFVDTMARQGKGFLAQFKYAMLGAEPARVAAKSGLGILRPFGRFATLAAGTFLAHGILTGGFLGSMDTAQEIGAQLSGEELVRVGKGRMWEGGSSPFEGVETEYFRPHRLHLMMSQAEQKATWGHDHKRFSPVSKFFLKNFTYHLERENYFSRPYPVTSAFGENIPVIGHLVAETFGKVIKPRRLMHPGAWMRASDGDRFNLEYGHPYQGDRIEPDYEMGAIKPGRPTSDASTLMMAHRTVDQFRELAGMTGWAKGFIQELVTGNKAYLPDNMVLASASQMGSTTRGFWNMELGGMFTLSETIRRLLPQDNSEIERYNPIPNSMPDWLPAKWHRGDPYTKLPNAEVRLPGPGFEALHPELRGTPADAYPDIYKYKILADVSPFSTQLRQQRERMYERRASGATTEDENAEIDRIDARLARVYNIFEDDSVHPGAYYIPLASEIGRAVTGTVKNAIRHLAAPGEYLVPFGIRPVQKLLTGHTAMGTYEQDRLYGTLTGFWNKPIQDWLRPSVNSALHLLGWSGKPAWRREADESQEYFDKVEFLRAMQNAQGAAAAGDQAGKKRFLAEAAQTRWGVNPNGSPLAIYWSLPKSERKYFNEFALAPNKDRKRILEMIPQDQQHLYRTLWERLDAGEEPYAGSPLEMDEEYLAERFYALGGYFDDKPLPGPQWVGWNPGVDLDDIAVRYVEEMGRDIHDFGYWESQLKRSYRQPYLEGSTDSIHGNMYGGRSKILSRMGGFLTTGQSKPWLSAHESSMAAARTRLHYEDDRGGEMHAIMQEMQRGY